MKPSKNIALAGNTAHLKPYVRHLRALGIEPVMLGGDGKIAITRRIEIVVLRIAASGHALTDLVYRWKRAGRGRRVLIHANSPNAMLRGLAAEGFDIAGTDVGESQSATPNEMGLPRRGDYAYGGAFFDALLSHHDGELLPEGAKAVCTAQGIPFKLADYERATRDWHQTRSLPLPSWHTPTGELMSPRRRIVAPVTKAAREAAAAQVREEAGIPDPTGMGVLKWTKEVLRLTNGAVTYNQLRDFKGPHVFAGRPRLYGAYGQIRKELRKREGLKPMTRDQQNTFDEPANAPRATRDEMRVRAKDGSGVYRTSGSPGTEKPQTQPAPKFSALQGFPLRAPVAGLAARPGDDRLARAISTVDAERLEAENADLRDEAAAWAVEEQSLQAAITRHKETIKARDASCRALKAEAERLEDEETREMAELRRDIAVLKARPTDHRPEEDGATIATLRAAVQRKEAYWQGQKADWKKAAAKARATAREAWEKDRTALEERILDVEAHHRVVNSVDHPQRKVVEQTYKLIQALGPVSLEKIQKVMDVILE